MEFWKVPTPIPLKQKTTPLCTVPFPFLPSIQGDWIHDETDSAGCQAIDNAPDIRIRGNFLFVGKREKPLFSQ